MGMHFSEPRGRDFFIHSAGGEQTLKRFENHFSKKWPFSKEQEDVIKRFFVREPDGRIELTKYLNNNPDTSLQVNSFDLDPQEPIDGMSIYLSANYVLKELSPGKLILVEKNRCMIDLFKYVF